jgi:hypothetical protein
MCFLSAFLALPAATVDGRRQGRLPADLRRGCLILAIVINSQQPTTPPSAFVLGPKKIQFSAFLLADSRFQDFKKVFYFLLKKI